MKNLSDKKNDGIAPDHASGKSSRGLGASTETFNKEKVRLSALV
jgi:hypothetical protein